MTYGNYIKNSKINPVSKCKFRFRCSYLLLTYATHIGVKELIKCITEQYKIKYKIKYKIAHESGDSEHDYLHTHILIYFVNSKRIDWTNARKFDYKGIHPQWKPIKTKEHWDNCVKYLDKENCVDDNLDGNEYPLNDGFSNNLIENIQKHRTFFSVINDKEISYEICNKMTWARCVWNARPKPNLSKDLILNEFQEYCYECLLKQENHQVLWVYDKEGQRKDIGKSTLTNWLIDCKDAFFCSGGAMKDIACAYQYEDIVVFDLQRDGENFIPYRAMESFKDGRIFSPKYVSHRKRFKVPAVVIFANFMPEISKLSYKRWVIWDVSKYPKTPIGSLNIIGNLVGSFLDIDDLSDF